MTNTLLHLQSTLLNCLTDTTDPGSPKNMVDLSLISSIEESTASSVTHS